MVALAPSVAAEAPPADVLEYGFDYSRSTRKMRFRLDGREWTVNRLVGQWEFVAMDRVTGRWVVRCQLLIKDGSGYVYVPGSTKPYHSSGDTCSTEVAHNHDQCQIGAGVPFPQQRDTHWRCCFARELSEKGEEAVWRLRDERTGELWFVKGYEGQVNVNWLDGGSHCFVDGPVTVDADGIAHF